MTDHDIHVAREKAEQLLSILHRTRAQLADALDDLDRARDDLDPGTLPSTSSSLIVTYGERAETRIGHDIRRIESALSNWTLPEMPPLDLSNVPVPVMYGATDEEAAKHGMKGDH